ncbi:MAG: winged helix DNA-binding domain-containing protein, partial [Actinomycetota bacterium]|nr:winged helix DNA-binding domain-containing protein [Actinomycetota bacterium]
HGPATDRDLARWAGLPLRDVRRGLALAAPQVADVGGGLVDLAVREPAAPLPRPRLLGSFEPVLLGWTSRDDVVGPETGLVTVNGIFRPFAMVDGRAVATWTLDRGRAVVTPFAPLDDAAAGALAEDGGAVVRWLAG